MTLTSVIKFDPMTSLTIQLFSSAPVDIMSFDRIKTIPSTNTCLKSLKVARIPDKIFIIIATINRSLLRMNRHLAIIKHLQAQCIRGHQVSHALLMINAMERRSVKIMFALARVLGKLVRRIWTAVLIFIVRIKSATNYLKMVL